uniref:DNA/RNA-binding domain-containing protein n=1 Tax=Neogobius melanostomus TaxID=47308 RepID=A0A8C6UW93_9GOBI
VSFLGAMCSRAILNLSESEEQVGECPLPAIKVSLDWLRLRPSVFHETAVHQRQHVWPWLVSLLNGFQPKEMIVVFLSPTAVPLPEEFELQGFLALRPALRTLDFTKGHQGHTQPFEQSPNDSGSTKSNISVAKGPTSVSIKENLKPREPSRDSPRTTHPKEPVKERFTKGSAAAKPTTSGTTRRRARSRRAHRRRFLTSVKAQTEQRKTPVSEVKKSSATPTQTTSTSQFVPIHHPGAFPHWAAAQVCFPPSAYMLTPPVPFHGLQGFAFSPGPVSVPGHFLPQAPPQPSKSSHPPHTQQRSPPQGSPASAGQPQAPGAPTVNQQQALQQHAHHQQAPHQAPQQVTLGKSPPHQLGIPQVRLNTLNQNSMFSQSCGKSLPPNSKPEAPLMPQEHPIYSLFETPWSPSLPASSDHSTPASQSPHSSNPSSLPSSPPTHNHNNQPFSNFGPIGTLDSRERRLVDRWKTDKKGPGSGFGLDYLPSAPSSESSWPQSSWTNQESPMEESTVLPDSLKVTHPSSLSRLLCAA